MKKFQWLGQLVVIVGVLTFIFGCSNPSRTPPPPPSENFVMMVDGGFRVMGGTQSECECVRTILPENSNVVTRELFLEAVDIA